MILRRWRARLFLASTVAVASACSSSAEDGAPAPTGGAAAASAPASVAAPIPCAPRATKRWLTDGTRGASSSVALTKNGAASVVLVADADQDALHLFDARSLEQLAVSPLEGQPTHVVVLGNGLVAVSLRGAAKVSMLELGAAPTDPIEVRCSIDVPVEPIAMFESGDKLYVASGAGASLSMLRVEDGIVDGSVDVPREPRSLLVDDETHMIFISHASGGIVSAIDPSGARPLERIDLRAGHRMKNLVEEDDAQREASQGFALASVDMGGGHLRILAPHTSVDPGSSSEPLSGSGYGGAFEHRAIADDLSVTVRAWLYVEAKPLARGALYAFRVPDDAGETVHLILPEVILGVTSAGVTVHGGFDASSRFSRSWSLTEYTFPSAPGTAGVATFRFLENQVRSLRVLGLQPPKDARFDAVVDVSRTATEPSAHVRLHVFD